jgi:hypothetical protein
LPLAEIEWMRLKMPAGSLTSLPWNYHPLIFVLMQTASESSKQISQPDELDRRLAMTYTERYALMMRLFRIGKMMEKAKVKERKSGLS